MSVISKELPDSPFEIVVDVFYYSQYRKRDGYFVQKSKYISLRDEFFEKFSIKYPQMPFEEVFSFISIYLMYKPAENNYEKSDFLFDEKIPINRICWMGPYLQEKGNYKYTWLIENMGEGIHHPFFFFFLLRGIIDFI